MSAKHPAVGINSDLLLTPMESGVGQICLPYVRDDWSSEYAKDNIRKAQLNLAFDRIVAEGRTGAKVVFDEGYTYGVSTMVRSKSAKWDTLAVDSRVIVNGSEEADSDDPTVLEALGIPKAPEHRDYSHEEMDEILSDLAGIDTSDVYDFIDGCNYGTMEFMQSGVSNQQLDVDIHAHVTVRFKGRTLMPMSAIDLCNFLVALDKHGEEVALAVLHRIYSGENED